MEKIIKGLECAYKEISNKRARYRCDFDQCNPPFLTKEMLDDPDEYNRIKTELEFIERDIKRCDEMLEAVALAIEIFRVIQTRDERKGRILFLKRGE